MKNSGAFFFLGDSPHFKKSKVYHCIYAKSEILRKINPSVEKGKIFFAYFEDRVDHPVGLISYKEYNEFLEEMTVRYNYLDYMPEDLTAIMEKKGIRNYSTKWFHDKYIFILQQLELLNK
jgi:hypothetical protein